MDNEELLNKNKLLEEELQKIKNELIDTKEHLKKYTAPIRHKSYYENHKQELLEKIKLSFGVYILFKSFTIYYLNQEYSIKLSKLFCLIIWNYDQMEKHINKIRKLSNGQTEFNKIFLELNSIFIYVKKIGLCKKNF